jgi:hypothetical protein
MIEHLTKVKNILLIPKAYLKDKKHNTKVVGDIVLFLMKISLSVLTYLTLSVLTLATGI